MINDDILEFLLVRFVKRISKQLERMEEEDIGKMIKCGELDITLIIIYLPIGSVNFATTQTSIS